MNCDELKRVMADFLNGNLSGEESREVRRHLASCRACASNLDATDKVEILPALDEEIEPSPDFAERFYSRLQEPRRTSPWRNPIALAAAAAIVLLAASLFFGRYYRGMTEAPDTLNDIALAENLPLLEDRAVLENLELLENFDAIEKLTIEKRGER
ncbi:MAG: anti-sigma factor [Acidobacteriota bacterium]|nr:anti-sigma factor [Acidobacteriota bacterium]